MTSHAMTKQILHLIGEKVKALKQHSLHGANSSLSFIETIHQ